MAIDLTKIQREIEIGFKAGEEDKDIAKRINLTESQVTNFRVLLGLKYSKAINVFEASKAVHWNDSSEQFNIPSFSIPAEVQQKLGLKDGYSYSFFAHITSKKTIEITILERDKE